MNSDHNNSNDIGCNIPLSENLLASRTALCFNQRTRTASPETKRPEREADLLLPSNFDIKDDCACNSAPPGASMLCIGTS